MGAFDGNLIDWNANTLSKIKVTTVNTAIAQNVLTKSMSARVFFLFVAPKKKQELFSALCGYENLTWVRKFPASKDAIQPFVLQYGTIPRGPRRVAARSDKFWLMRHQQKWNGARIDNLCSEMDLQQLGKNNQ